jgi:HIRAN domain
MKSLYTMVGMQYRGSEKIVAAMSSGEPLTLRREPDNPHDLNAVAVYSGRTHIAYIKGIEARKLACEMDAKQLPFINGVFRITADRWPQVEVDSR